MAKDTAPPKAVNIIRPTHSFSPVKAASRVSSSSSSAVSHSSFVSAPPALSRKTVRVASGAKILHDRPSLNIYHPPSPPQRPKAATNRLPPTVPPTPPSPPARPHFEIYKPSRPIHKPPSVLQQHAPVRAIPSTHNSITNPSEQYVQHQRPKPQRARSVLGPISRPEEITHPMARSNSYENHQADMDDGIDDEDDDDIEQRATYDDDGQRESDSDTGEDDEDDEDSPVNEARVNRMIEDLEISNRSLLAVNAMLEATVRKQASEVTKMKTQLSGQAPIVIPPLPVPAPSEDLSDDEWEKDETFCRLRQMTETMIEQGQTALAYEVKGLGRVLSQYEADESDEDEGSIKQEEKPSS